MKGKNIVFHPSLVSIKEREKSMGHKSCCIWFTGYSGSGKSTLAHGFESLLIKNGFHAFVLDGDNIRLGLNKDLGFSREHRIENIRRVGEASKLMVDAGLIALSAFISPYRNDRDHVRSLFKENQFIEIYVKCPISVCEDRDVKGLYKKARDGAIPDFTGISAPYEEPLKPELTLDTDLLNIEDSIQKIYNFLKMQGIIDGEVAK